MFVFQPSLSAGIKKLE
nr:hypothetical protein [Fischerella thermalis]